MKVKNRLLFAAAVVSLVILAVYLPALRNGFVEWDDNLYAYDNLNIRSLNAAFFKWAGTSFYTGNWHPLTWISHALDYAVWGLNPFGHHLTSILLHAINTFLVVILIYRLISARKTSLNLSLARGDQGGEFLPEGRISPPLDERAVITAAVVTGALFGLHPLHVESVAWVSERKDLLCGLFFLLSVLYYLDYTAAAGQDVRAWSYRHSLDRKYFLSLFLFSLALMSKPMAVSLPFVLLLLDWHPLGRIGSANMLLDAVKEKLPYVAAGLVVSLLTLFAQRTAGGMEYMIQLPFWTRILVAAKALMVYLVNMLYPVNLSPYYPYPRVVSISSPEYLLSVAAVIGITAGTIAVARKQRLWFAAWGYYLVTLLPVLGLVQVGGQAMADRYTYLPGLAPFLVCGLVVARLSTTPQTFRVPFWLVAGGVCCAAVVLSISTVRQIGVWKDGIGLWTYVIQKDAEHAPLPYVNRGYSYLKAGDRQRAIQDYTSAIELNPEFTKALYSRGTVYGMTGDQDKAIEDYTRVIAVDPAFKDALLNRAAAFDAKGLTDKAIEDYTQAIDLSPADADIRIFRGMALKKKGLLERAITDYTAAIKLNPLSREAYNNRGAAYMRLGKLEQAVEDYNRAIDLDPRFALAYCNRGIVFGMMGRVDEAIQDYTNALSLQPDFVKAYLERGNLYANTDRKQLAENDFHQACSQGSKEGCGALRAYAEH